MLKNIGTKLLSSVLMTSMLAYFTAPVLAYTKDETVYSKLDNNGNTYQTIVSDHLKNLESADFLDDLSDLMDIENVSGDQEFKNENGKIVWKADGEDIYYQGNTKKELPIGCKITYKLDGKTVEKKDITGKSGTVKVKFEFTNIQTRAKKLKELANEYKSFTNIDENTNGTVKFIMMIDSLKKEEDKKENAVPEDVKKEN